MTMPSQQARELPEERAQPDFFHAAAIGTPLVTPGASEATAQSAPAADHESPSDVMQASSPREKLRSYKALVARAADVFGDELIASRWLSTPSPDLAGKVPLQLAEELHYDSKRLEAALEPVFVRIEHGIYA